MFQVNLRHDCTWLVKRSNSSSIHTKRTNAVKQTLPLIYGFFKAHTRRGLSHSTQRPGSLITPKITSALLTLFLLTSTIECYGSTLNYSLDGLSTELKKNVEAWLGENPKTPEERSNFLADLDNRVAKSLQALGYYQPDILINIERSEPTWKLAISVTQNQPVLIVDIDIQLLGDALEDPAFTALISSTPLVKGDILHHGRYEAYKKSLMHLAQQRGYFTASITKSRINVNTGANTAQIILYFDSGPRYRFGTVRFDENMLDASLEESLQTFKEGDYFNLAQIQEFQANLQRTQYFSSIIFKPLITEAEDNHMPVELDLFPAKRHSIDVGVGYSTDTEERISLIWRTPRINSHGHSQETRLEYSSVNPSGRVIYKIPLTHPLNDTLLLSARKEENEFGDLDSQQKELAIRRETLIEGGWIRSYSLRALNESWDAESLQTQSDYLLPGLTFSHKFRTGPFVDPLRGFSQFYQLEAGNEDLGSDIDLMRAYGKFTYVTTLKARHRVVTRAELGAVFIDGNDRKHLAPSLGFFTGGAQSIRGFAYQAIGNKISGVLPGGKQTTLVVGGDRLMTASMEYQYYFSEQWRGALFSDFGDAFDEGDFDAHYSAGFGVHYLTIAGAIKVELANSLSNDNPDWRLHLNIGAEF